MKTYLYIKTVSPVIQPDPLASNTDGVLRTIRKAMLDSEGAVFREVFLTANGLRGRLRRAAAQLVLNRIAESGVNISIEAFRGLICGAATGGLAAAPLDMPTYAKVVDDPYIALFGGGQHTLLSKMAVGDLYLCTQRNIAAGYVPEYFFSASVESEVVNRQRSFSHDTTLALSSPMQNLGDQVVSEFETKQQEWLSSIATNRQQRAENKMLSDEEKEEIHQSIKTMVESELMAQYDAEKAKYDALSQSDKEKEKEPKKPSKSAIDKAVKQKKDLAKKLDISNMMTYECIAEGSPFVSTINAKQGQWSNEMRGIYLLAMLDVIENYNFGIKGATRFGRFVAELVDGETKESLIAFAPDLDRYELSETALTYVEAAEAWLNDKVDETYVSTLERIYGITQ